MLLKNNETFCVNSWCRRVYLKKDKDLFHLCPECNEKDLKKAEKLYQVSIKNTKYNDSRIYEKQKDFIFKAIELNNNSASIVDILNYINKVGSFPRRRKYVCATELPTDTFVRNLANKMARQKILRRFKEGVYKYTIINR